MKLEDRDLLLVWCPEDHCDQLAEIYDALEIPANQTSCGHSVLVVSARCLAGHPFRGELDGRFKAAEVPS